MQVKKGIFTQSDIVNLINSKRIETLKNYNESHISISSLDLTVEEEIYEVDFIIKPSAQRKEKIRDIIEYMNPKKINLGDVLYPGKVYLAKASINLDFPKGIYMTANAKSSSGRNFLLVRVLADGIGMFDGFSQNESGYTGEIWLTIEPLAYPVIITEKETYSQIRILNYDTKMNDSDLNEFLLNNNILYKRDTLEPYKQSSLSLLTNDGSVLTTIYSPANKLVGYKVKDGIVKPVDLTRRDLEPSDYFEKIYADELYPNSDSGYIKLKKGEKYLLCTNEVLNVPNHICSELKALDPRLGLFFSHFAGFFDPGFEGTGTLEVIAMHDMVLRKKDPVAKFEFEYLRGAEATYGESTPANYKFQVETKLPKQFKNFEV